MKPIMIITSIVLAIGIFLLWFVYYQDNHLVVTSYEYSSSDISKEFDGYKIVQLSDLHDKQFGENQEKLISHIDSINPDAIFLTGDFVTKKSIEYSTELIEKLSEKYEMFFVTGNHEARHATYHEFKKVLIENNVHMINNEAFTITKGESHLNIVGLQDLAFYRTSEKNQEKKFERKLKDLTKDLTGPTLLLSHRPEYIDVYSKYDVNLVFSGHAHGGQFILPFVGSVYSTDQGLFPELTRGKHEKDGTTMIISRGLGNLAPVPRLFNYPEIVVVTLHSA